MSDLFRIVGDNFFKPLTSYYKSIYLECLRIIYDSYRTELSYGIDREALMLKLTNYFDDLSISDIQFTDEMETISDSRAKASAFLRKLLEFGWVEYEIGIDQQIRVVMPSYAISVIRNLETIISGRETEYQSEISAIYSLLMNPDLLYDPYPQIVKPVYDRTADLFTALKQLNTNIKRYIDELTADKTAEEILANYFTYAEEIGSKAYHRLYTSDNVSKFRNMILVKLDDIRNNPDIFERVAWGYQKVEGEPDLEAARDMSRKVINDVMDYFNSYDDIVREIEKKHARYLSSTVKRARFLLLNTNNTEGKISTVLRYLAMQCNEDEMANLSEDASDEICSLFNIFTQGFISNESVKSVTVSRKITAVKELFKPLELSEEERSAIRIAAYERNKNRFSKRNINAFVDTLLREKESEMASSLEINSRRDMIRLIFISLYGQTGKTSYQVIPSSEVINKQGFTYNDFEIRRKEK